MTRVVLRCPQHTDELSEPEVFTLDLFYVAKVTSTSHLSHLTNHGLSKVGTEIHPGMIVIGKIGAKKELAMLTKMTELEYYALSEQERWDELRAYYQGRFYDASVYAPNGCSGTVVAAYFEIDGKPREYPKWERAFGTAVVEIEPTKI